MVQRMAESSIVIKIYIYEEFCKKKIWKCVIRLSVEGKNGTIYHFNQMKKAQKIGVEQNTNKY